MTQSPSQGLGSEEGEGGRKRRTESAEAAVPALLGLLLSCPSRTFSVPSATPPQEVAFVTWDGSNRANPLLLIPKLKSPFIEAETKLC